MLLLHLAAHMALLLKPELCLQSLESLMCYENDLGFIADRAGYISVGSFMCVLNQPLVTDPTQMKGTPSSSYIKAKNALAAFNDCDTCFKFTVNFSSYFVIGSV